MNVPQRIGFAILAVLAMASISSVAALQPSDRKAPTLKDLDAAPANFLGQTLQIVGWLAPSTNAFGTGAELSFSVEARSHPSRVHFLIPNALATSVADLKESRKARIAGTVLAAESARVGYIFEVDEIAVLNDADEVVATLKPAVGPRPTATVKKSDPIPRGAEPTLPSESPKKTAGVPTILVVGAALMAALLAVLAIIGVRLLKGMKRRPRPVSRVKRDQTPSAPRP